MIPLFDDDGLLPPGVHRATWEEFAARYGTSNWRQRLMAGLRAALDNLKAAGCRTVYVDGSFVTSKEVPNDFDACWEEAGVEPAVLDPVLLTFDPGRATQKSKYMGELFPASIPADPEGLSFLEFFQTDKESEGWRTVEVSGGSWGSCFISGGPSFSTLKSPESRGSSGG